MTQLIDYIAALKAHGAADDFVVELLERNGWPRKEIYAAFNDLYSRLTGIEAPHRVSGFADSARDAFLYLLSFGTLAVWTLGLGSVFFTVIDSRYADPVFQNGYRNVRDEISGSMASLIVGFPAYLATMRFLLRDMARKPDKADSAIRKWLTYMALLLSAGTVICDMVTFVSYFLRGALTTPFLTKVLAVLVIAGGVFWYYIEPLERRESRV